MLANGLLYALFKKELIPNEQQNIRMMTYEKPNV